MKLISAKGKWRWAAAAGTAFILLVLLGMIGVQRERSKTANNPSAQVSSLHTGKPEASGPVNQANPDESASLQRSSDSDIFRQMKSLPLVKDFRLDANAEHLVKLLEDRGHAVYLQKHRLYVVSPGRVPTVIGELPAGTAIRVWRGSNELLIGCGDAKHTKSVVWQHVQLSTAGVSARWLTGPEDFTPDRVLAVYHLDHRLFAKAELPEVGPAEFIAADAEWKGFDTQYVHFMSRKDLLALVPDERGRDAKQANISDLPAPKIFTYGTALPVYALQDAFGVLVWQEAPKFRIRRFAGVQLEDIKAIAQSDGTIRPAGFFQTGQGEKLMALLFDDNHALYAYSGKLWQSSGPIHMNNQGSFYAVSSNSVIVMKYGDRSKRKFVEPQSYIMKGALHEFTFHDAEWLQTKGTMLVFKRPSGTRFVEINDLLHDRLSGTENRSDLEEFYEAPLPAFEKIAVPLPKAAATVRREIPQTDNALSTANFGQPPEGDKPSEAMPGILPADVKQAMDNQLAGSGDVTPHWLVRKFGSDWYVLINRIVYRIQDRKLVRLKELPVAITAFSGNSIVNYGPADWIQDGDQYFISDTFGGRVLRLNGKFKVTGEAIVPYPTMLKTDQAGNLAVRSLKGIIRFDKSLKELGETPVAFAKPAAMQHLQVRSGATLEAGGWSWTYAGDRLYQQKGDTFRSFYVGTVVNSADRPDFIRKGSRIFLRFDNRVLGWESSGDFVKEIEMPRSSPDAEYIMTSIGEGSHVYLSDNGTLYDVQGYSVIGVNLDSGKQSVYYHQDYADIGRLEVDNGILWFTVSPYNDYRYAYNAKSKPHNAELVGIRLSDGKQKRWRLDRFYQIRSVGDGKLILGGLAADGQKGATSGISVELDKLAF